MWIVFEGLDKSGKTTLEWEFLKATNFKHVIIDRGPVGYIVFDSIFDRTSDYGEEQFAQNINTMIRSKDFLVVYCKVQADTAMQRLKEHNEECPYDYKDAQRKYDIAINRLYKEFGVNVITIDTTFISIEKCVELIVEKLKEVQRSEL